MNILGIKIDQVNMEEATELVCQMVSDKGKHYVVTPNIEFLMLAQKDGEFKTILNHADLSIPDSARLGWAQKVLSEKSFVKKLCLWPFFLLPKLVSGNFQVVTGTDLMDRLVKESAERGFTIGLLGGQGKLAEKLKECYQKRYPRLKITLADSDWFISQAGEVVNEQVLSSKYQVSSKKTDLHNTTYLIPNTDILFVAFGQGKQEKWIAKNLETQPVKVMMGVGGAFDYLSGEVKRAPLWMRNLGLEWFFRLINQPWRIKRFGSLVKFIFLILFKTT